MPTTKKDELQVGQVALSFASSQFKDRRHSAIFQNENDKYDNKYGPLNTFSVCNVCDMAMQS